MGSLAGAVPSAGPGGSARSGASTRRIRIDPAASPLVLVFFPRSITSLHRSSRTTSSVRACRTQRDAIQIFLPLGLIVVLCIVPSCP
jgi:hypothetical protein